MKIKTSLPALCFVYFCNIIQHISLTMLKRVGVSAAQNLLGSKAGPSKTSVLAKMTTNKSQVRNMLFSRTYYMLVI